ncbi:MAG TPA: hypothetical protein PK156_34020 [Polyangium sp.]|nr:hypothetical protein [Polyangium sp.]
MAKSSVGLCVSCAEIFDAPSRCPKCGAAYARTTEDIEAWETKRLLRRIETWRSERLVTKRVAGRLIERIEKGSPLAPDVPDEPIAKIEQTEAVNEPAAEPAAHPLERGADALIGGTTSFWKELSTRHAKMVAALEADGPHGAEERAPSSSRQPDAGIDAGRAVFARGQGVVAPGIEALVELDAHDPSEAAKPLGALQVFWFIGTLLVLSGSVMGVREAWRSLEGAWRPLAIAGALFGYHAAFVGLSRFLARRSVVTGRVLGGIAAGLLPVVMVAAAVARGMAPGLGLAAGGVLMCASAISLFLTGPVFARGAGLGLALGLVPSFAIELFLGSTEVTERERITWPFYTLVPVFVSALASRFASTEAGSVRSAAAVAASLYGAIAVGIFAYFGAPDQPAIDLSNFSAAVLAALAWTSAMGTAAWLATRHSGEPRGIVALAPNASSVMSIVALALVLGVACAGTVAAYTVSRFDLVSTGSFVWIPTIVTSVGFVLLCYEASQRPGAIHLAVPLAFVAVALGSSVLFNEGPPISVAMTAIIPAGLFLAAPFTTAPRRVLVGWATVTSFGVTFITFFSEFAQLDARGLTGIEPCIISAMVAGCLSLSAHFGGRATRTFPHYLGAVLMLIALLAHVVPSHPEPFGYWLGYALIAVAVVYGVAALPYGLLAGKATGRPFDDVSMIAILVVSWLVIFLVPAAPNPPSSRADVINGVFLALPALCSAAILILRALRDESNILTLHAGFVLAATADIIAGQNAPPAFVAGVMALALVVPAMARTPNPEGSSPFGRSVFGYVPLPLGGRGRTLLDGFALAGSFLAIRSVIGALNWVGSISSGALDFDRPFVLFGLIGVIGVAFAGFATRAIEVLRARGHIGTMALLGVAIVITALANRIGRPLPPEVVARNLTIVAVLVWLVARLFVHYGPRLGKSLDRPEHGKNYHYIPHLGVGALGLILALDAYLVGTPLISRGLAVVPPLFPFGTALAFFLLYRSSRWAPFLSFGFAGLLGFSFLVGAQKAILGPDLTPLDPPGGRWVLTAIAERCRLSYLDPTLFLLPNDTEVFQRVRALVGASVFVLATAGLLVAMTRVAVVNQFVAVRLLGTSGEKEEKDVKTAIEIWAAVGAGLLTLELTMWPTLLPALVLVAAGALAVLARSVLLRTALPAVGAALVVHAAAHLGSTVPDWGGPMMALLALGAIAGGIVLSRRKAYDVNVLLVTQVIALGLACLSIAYALAVRAPTSQADAGLVRVASALTSLDGSWARSFSVAISLGILAVAAAAGAWSYRAGLATFFSALPPILLAEAAIAAAAALAYSSPDDVFPRIITRDGALAGGLIALATLASHFAAIGLAWKKHEPARRGTVVGRDVALVLGVGIMMLFVMYPEPGGLSPGKWGLVALALPLVVCVDAIGRFGTARHVYLAQTLVVAMYAFLTQSMNLRPEVDALLGLAYGFTLLGVAVIARRNKLTTVADATRRFLMVLPFLIALLTINDSTNSAALFALGSSVLYGTIAVAERSRIFGSLAALAGNAALLVFALAQGLDGIEIYVGPLGLLVMALAQIFATKIDASARSALRVIGGVFLYVPSGLKLALRLGAAEDPTYSVIFGVVCLVGVLAGVILRVRAYLALATLALTLDVVANLVYAGLRDHRLGFILLSVSGLLILGLMIAITLFKDHAWALAERLRARVRGWD